MKQEHEMTPGVLVPDDMSAGDYKARCAVLEAELAELRKRVSVTSDRDALLYLMERFDSEVSNCPVCGHSEATSDMDSAYYLRDYLSAAPAPVERVEQEAVAPPVAWQHRKPIISDIHGNAKEWSDWIDGQGLAIWPHRPLYTTPQPAPTAAPSRDVIRATLMDHGFTIKTGHDDLKPYVYEAVEALFARPAPAAQDVAGLELAAKYVEQRAEDYDRDHGLTEPDTGYRTYPGDGAEYMEELDNIAAGIRALVHQSGGAK
ncbi:hypothetical protein [Halopseudomonas sp.]|uniref:hypothetical protein n=1 Tax=Halopseudomonas sp. TaxID=2901191 RepID=UPI00311D7961